MPKRLLSEPISVVLVAMALICHVVLKYGTQTHNTVDKSMLDRWNVFC